MSSAEQVVQDFCAAASTRDPAVLRAYTLDSLACELAGNQRPRAATDLVTNTANLPDPAAPEPAGPRLVRVDPARQADESSPAVQLKRKYEEVARLAARQHRTGLTCDPDKIYSIVFG